MTDSVAGDSSRNLGSVLRGARLRKGLSLRQVESRTAISNGYLSQLETGKTSQLLPTSCESCRSSTVYLTQAS